MTEGAYECSGGIPHKWEYGGRSGQRRCSACGLFGYIPRLMTGYEADMLKDSQGVVFWRCEKQIKKNEEGPLEKCRAFAVGHDPVGSYNRKEWRCCHHRVVATPVPTVSTIRLAVANYFLIDVSELSNRTHVRPREVAMYLARKLTGATFPEIGGRFNLHAVTVSGTVKRIEAQQAVDEELRTTLLAVRERIERDYPSPS